MIILGVDPGLRLTGYGVVTFKPTNALKPVLVDGGVIRLNTKTAIPDRLVELATELDALIEEHEPDVCAVEQLYSNYAHPRTAILMGRAPGRRESRCCCCDSHARNDCGTRRCRTAAR